MSCCTPPDRDSGANLSPISSCCPTCQQTGQPIDKITPGHTLKTPFRKELSEEGHYHFCDNPECHNVYFSGDGTQIFTTEQLINRVTCKDPSSETPLCYCFKITKADAISEYQESGESSVLKQIEQKMSEKPCFCDKSNPRGICCMTEIASWLKSHSIDKRSCEN